MSSAEAETAVRLRPRRRTWDRNRELHEEVDLTAEAVTALFGMRMADAARSLGVSPTTLKIVCRRLGIERWPYSRTGRLRVRTGIVMWERSREGLPEVELTVEALTPLFGMRVSDAARSLDIGLSTLKTVCRRLGIERWPYSRGFQGEGGADELWCIADDLGEAGAGAGLGEQGEGVQGEGLGVQGEGEGGGALWFSAEGRAESGAGAEGGEDETDLWFLAETRSEEEGTELSFLACE